MELTIPAKDLVTVFKFYCERHRTNNIKSIMEEYIDKESAKIDQCFLYALEHNYVKVSKICIESYKSKNEDISGLIERQINTILRHCNAQMFSTILPFFEITIEHIHCICKYDSYAILKIALNNNKIKNIVKKNISLLLYTCAYNQSHWCCKYLLESNIKISKNCLFVSYCINYMKPESTDMVIEYAKKNKKAWLKYIIGYTIRYNKAMLFFKCMSDKEIIENSDHNFTISSLSCSKFEDMYFSFLLENEYPKIHEKKQLEDLFYDSFKQSNYRAIKFMLVNNLIDRRILERISKRNEELFQDIIHFNKVLLLTFFVEFNINIKNKYRKKILNCLIKCKEIKLFKSLTNDTILRDIDFMDESYTEATKNGCTEIVKYLLNHSIINPHIEFIDNNYDTVDNLLTLAIQYGYKNMVEVYLEDGRINPIEYNFKALEESCAELNDIFELLLDKTKVIEHIEEWFETVIYIIISKCKECKKLKLEDDVEFYQQRIIRVLGTIHPICTKKCELECFCMQDSNPTSEVLSCTTCKKNMHLMCILEWISEKSEYDIFSERIKLEGTCPFCKSDIVMFDDDLNIYTRI